MIETLTIHGGCLCGAVRYKLNAAIQDVYYCHCRDCQLLSGSAFHVLGIVDRSALSIISGQLGTFAKAAESGHEMSRQFCVGCGTPLFVQSDRFPEITMFTVSSLDDPRVVRPSFEIWTRSKLPWSTIHADLKSFSRGALDGD